LVYYCIQFKNEGRNPASDRRAVSSSFCSQTPTLEFSFFGHRLSKNCQKKISRFSFLFFFFKKKFEDCGGIANFKLEHGKKGTSLAFKGMLLFSLLLATALGSLLDGSPGSRYFYTNLPFPTLLLTPFSSPNFQPHRRRHNAHQQRPIRYLRYNKRKRGVIYGRKHHPHHPWRPELRRARFRFLRNV